jgi:hypothetical protein
MNCTDHFLDTQRQAADPEADQLITALFEQNQQGQLYATFKLKKQDVLSLGQSDLRTFLLHQSPNPIWMDVAKIKAGQAFYKKFATPIMTLLGGLSLPYCYAASPGNKALYLSQKMRQAPGKRLLDTAAFIIAVCSPGSLGPEAEGYLEINKIRMIHSLSRYHILKGKNWDTAWGLPINQEDMAGTNLAFSYLILKGLQSTGFSITNIERDGFLHLWRYIGYHLNIHADLLTDSMTEAGQLERAIVTRHFKFSKEGATLTKELIAYYKTLIPGAEKNLMDAQIRYWLGAKVADCLDIKTDWVKDAAVVVINGVRNIRNGFAPEENSYDVMMENHMRVRAQFEREDAAALR